MYQGPVPIIRSRALLLTLRSIHMERYCQLTIPVQDEAQLEMLIASLTAIGFDGFEEVDGTLKAFIDESEYVQADVDAVLAQYQLSSILSMVEKQNWNALWESNFDPVIVDDFVGIRASFHPPIDDVAYQLTITPKMSFGTGHHATTYSVMQLMREIDFKGKRVFDFGTGTGILAILAEKLGATNILAIDHDPWCVENSLENIQINECVHIQVQQADHAATPEQYDVVIANINKNIILDNLQQLAAAAAPTAHILLSGLLTSDAEDIINACKTVGWRHLRTVERGAWIAIHLIV